MQSHDAAAGTILDPGMLGLHGLGIGKLDCAGLSSWEFAHISCHKGQLTLLSKATQWDQAGEQDRLLTQTRDLISHDIYTRLEQLDESWSNGTASWTEG